MLVVGLTGGIATGKSTVSKLLQARKVPLVDADLIAREVVAPGTSGLQRIVKTFGDDILLPDGSLYRKKLGDIVFNDEEKRKKLNAIVHPAVRWGMIRRVIKLWSNSEKYCVLDIPLLIESGIWKWVGTVVVVYCPAEIQLKRFMERDNLTVEEATARLNSQLPTADKVHYADIVIDNSGTLKDLEDQVDALVKKLDAERGWVWLVGYIIPFVSLFSAVWWLTSRRIRHWRKADKKRN